MGADELLRYLTWALFLLVFLFTLVEAIRYPSRASTDVALLFLAPTLVILISIARQEGLVGSEPLVGALSGSLLMALAYLLLRLVDDFARVPSAVLRLAEVGLALLVAGYLALTLPRPAWHTLLAVLYFVGLQLYATVVFVRESRRSNGVTRRRMQAAVIGSVALVGLAILVATYVQWLPPPEGIWNALFQLLALGSGMGYFLGFAPPGWLRQAWRAPELRAFLSLTASLRRLPATDGMIRELELAAAAAFGAPDARIGLWDEATQLLRFRCGDHQLDLPPGETLVGRSFMAQRPAFSADVPRDDPAYAKLSRERGIVAVLAAPITIGERRLGMLVVYSPRAPIFAQDDLMLLQLLADQAALLLESRVLIDEAARSRAREQVAALKEDFLSAAAHDLKTPVTILLAQAQLLELRAMHDPEAPADPAGIRRMVDEAKRMKILVGHLLDGSWAEHGGLTGAREKVDLVGLAREICQRERPGPHLCVVEATGPVVGEYDAGRMAQVVGYLVENAVKYSPQGDEVRVRVWLQGEEARLSVADRGIGILEADRPHVFDRFYRGGNVDDRHYSGMGLGLFICRGIVEEHGGRIWFDSAPGQGSTFHVALPARG